MQEAPKSVISSREPDNAPVVNSVPKEEELESKSTKDIILTRSYSEPSAPAGIAALMIRTAADGVFFSTMAGAFHLIKFSIVLAASRLAF